MKKSRPRKNRKKSISQNVVEKSLVKIVAVLLLLALNWSGIMAVRDVLAYYNDQERADGNFNATSLDFSLDFTRSDGFCTKTQGGWGTGAQGDNPGAYREANFDSAFPTGLIIGDLFGYHAHFSSSTNIENFLPAGGTPASLTANHENPTDTEAGVLAGQVVALTLNLGFDDFDPDFSANTSTLRNYRANSASSSCAALTAGEVLTEANKILSSQFSIFSPSDINECVTEINEKFDDCSVKKLTPDEGVGREIDITNVGDLNFQHQLKIEENSGDTDFCQALEVKAYLNGILAYSGNLLDFIYAPAVFSTSTDNEWTLDIGLPAEAPSSLQNKTCGLKYTVSGWQIDFSNNGWGFNDEETVIDTVLSGDWSKALINKVYYDVDVAHGTDANNEWVELYNPSDSSMDLSGWKICDNTSCDTLPASTTASSTIPAGGFMVIANRTSTWSYWEIPNDVAKINLNSQIGGGLGNVADMLVLKNSAGQIVDQMNWGTPDADWANYNSDIWNPGAVDVPDGHMLARVPTGTDTDVAADWHDLGLPQVTVISPNGGETWWVGRTSTVEWLATNPNGDNNLLTVDLWYSKDSGATWGSIAKGIANTGSYDFRVPLCFDNGVGGCYYAPSATARVKVVVHGPENFMVQNWDKSDHDFCPPIDYSLLLPEEIEMLKDLGLYESGDEILPIDEPIIEVATTTEDSATTTVEVVVTDTSGSDTAEPVIEDAVISETSGDDSSAPPAETVDEPENNIDDQPADTTEDAPVAPIEAVVESPAIETQPVITVEPPAPVEPAPGPDPVPPPADAPTE